MPDDRFIHRRLGHSEKVSSLSDFEFRVWVQFLLSADDFGVMRFSAATLEADCDALAEKSAKVQKALARLEAVALMATFKHQNRTYCYQRDWQDWQKVDYPRATLHPAPPLDGLSEKTRELFSKHPGGWGRKVRGTFGNGSSNVPRTDPEPFGERSGEISPKPLAVSHKPVAIAVSRPPMHPARAHGMPTLTGGSHRSHAWCGERICVPEFLHERFLKAIGGSSPDAALKAFYLQTVESIPDSQPIESDPVKFWPPLVSQRWPPTDAAVGTRTAALQRATAEFLRGGR